MDPIDLNELKQNKALPSPGEARMNIMRLCRQEDVSLSDLVTQIQADPVLAGRIVKIGNGAMINKGRPKVAISKDLLLLIGLDAVRQLALAISLATERRDNGCEGFENGRFWSRTVAMACASQALAEYYGEAPPSEMFACGMLANIGHLGLASLRPQSYARVLAQASSLAELKAAEKAQFGYTHLELSAAMMQDWDMPRLFCDAVLHHHMPAQSGWEEASRQMKLARMLHVAGVIADYCVAPPHARAQTLQTLLAAGAPLEGAAGYVVALCDRVGRDWMEWGAMVRIATHALPPTREVMAQVQAP